MRKFGLIGKNISYSFSRNYFKNKFEIENISNAFYENFDIEDINAFESELKHQDIKGFNVTIPYKESIIPYLDKLNKKAKAIGAVNTIRISKKGKYIGYNTDFYGFKKALKPYLETHHKKALILGTGGASKAVAYALKSLNIKFLFVSRHPKKDNEISYLELSEKLVKKHRLIINCTPLGTHPNINNCPDIPYDSITKKHILFDLIYNPEETKFLTIGKLKGATIVNGQGMLELQAEKSWKIWNR
ncbi:shikimate dehydrogenase [uncultured Lacinutrix sp.]|uniref:shikimate dehydrogenase family protein n=1 Tax=uncultured Lacinutrix sp. TaxID=574032 RepID=UPI002622BBF4|nr:shikimate dehydrogenase [uncultured Lacinutrix sp.]